MIDPKKREWQCVCNACGDRFTFLSIAPCRMCDPCSKIMCDFIFGRITVLPERLAALL